MDTEKFEEDIEKLKKDCVVVPLEEFKLKQTNKFIEKIEHLRRSLMN